ncbi:MAG: M48 family metalloprotease, partial [Acidobacteriota bacterium]
MKNIIRNLIVAISLFGLFGLFGVISAGAFAQTQQEQPTDKSGKKAKEEKPKEKKEGGFLGIGGKTKAEKAQKEEQKAEKQEREYQKLLTNAHKKYDQKDKEYDLDFKARVDEHYKDLRRQHSEQAFLVNTYDTQDERVTFTGDKLKTEDTLYDNPLVQDYVNRVGQSLVPTASPYRYAFKVILSPVPQARSLSTGTIYISTGLLSLVDNEAQLAYILGHEIAHTEKKHWLQDALVANEMEDAEAKRQKVRTGVSLGLTAATMLSGGLGRGMGGTVSGLMVGSFAYPFISSIVKLTVPNKAFSWDRVQENEADEEGLRLMFNRNYDPREVPKLYARLQGLSEREPRTAEGFLAQTERIGERIAHFNPLLASQTVNANLMRGSSNLRSKRGGNLDGGLVSPLEAGKPFGTAEDAEKREKASTGQVGNLDALLKEKLDKGEIVGSTAEFNSVMADLKRDNGVRAFYYDMFQMALTNLSEALEIRSNDPYTYFYYGKVLNLTARGPAEKARAMKAFETAIDLDKRGVLAGP